MLELRQYSLRPGRRDDLAALFERHFVEALEATGMEVPGLFEDLDDPDRLVWWRGFADMASRRRALADFYLHGSVWRQHGAAANATMVDSDDVLLLAPAYVGDGYPARSTPRVTAADRDAAPGRLVVDVVPLRRFGETGVTGDEVARRVREAAAAEGAEVVLVALTHPEPNDFPALPVRDEQVAVWLLRYPDDQTRARLGRRMGLRDDDEQVRLRALPGSRIWCDG